MENRSQNSQCVTLTLLLPPSFFLPHYPFLIIPPHYLYHIILPHYLHLIIFTTLSYHIIPPHFPTSLSFPHYPLPHLVQFQNFYLNLALTLEKEPMSHYLKDELYELIKKDERIFDFIQEGSLDGLWYWDLEKPENEWMNARFWEVMGYDPDEMPHKSGA